MESVGVYISVPFCKAKCTFCNFASGAIGNPGSSVFAEDRIDGYVERLCAEVRGVKARAARLGAALPGVVDTMYFGGGTPSLLREEHLERIFAAVWEQFMHAKLEFPEGAEVTLECAPGQLSDATLAAAVRLGVNRVSFGVQSFVDRESAAVGRLHSAAECVAEIARVRAAGIDEISLDLIAGLPGQTAESWELSLAGVVEAGVPHASVYLLEVDEESRLGRELISGGPRYGARTVPGDEAMTQMYARACAVFERAGIAQYEISNFARAGHESKHNLKYWQRKPYLGFGLDAHSMLSTQAGAVRFANADEMGPYLAGDSGEITFVDGQEAAEEAVFLGLRRNEGLPERVVGAVAVVDEMVRAGLMQRERGRVMLTGQGRMVSNDVFGELLRGAGV